MRTALVLLVAAVIWPFAARPLLAQIKADEQSASGKGPQLGRPLTQRIKVGVVVKASGGPCLGIYATSPFPSDWAEQAVNVVVEDVSPYVQDRAERTISGTVKQMMIDIPELPAGQTARCVLTYEVTRRVLLPPKATDIYTIPKKPDRAVLMCLGPSPYIESRQPKIISLAKKITAGKTPDWKKVEAIFDFVRDNVKYVHGDLKGAVRSLHDKTGDSEDLASLFIALCRAVKIPARTVWVPGHCYPEFYLTDDDGQGHWFPCQVAGTREFGGISETRIILQKGDNFKDPDRPGDKLRYVSEFLKGAGGGEKPQVTFVREVVGL